MNLISISQLKTNPASVLNFANDYPVAISKQNKIKAYMVGKELYDSLLSLLEDRMDGLAVQKSDFSKGRDFEEVAAELGI